MTTLEELRQVRLFEGLTDEMLREVLEEGSEQFIPAGEVGGREGEPLDHLSVILEGEFRWSKRVDGGEVVMNTYGPGEFFAEVPLLLGKPFLATWRALADSRMFALPNETFRRMLTTYPSFSNTVLEMMAQRIQVLYSVAQQRERLGSLGTLAAGLAHELNNPTSASRRAAGRLHNAVDAVVDGDETGCIRLRTIHERDRLLVEISDNGPGIPEEIQDRIFEPFFTTKDVGKGAGFGLDVSYRIVDRMARQIKEQLGGEKPRLVFQFEWLTRRKLMFREQEKLQLLRRFRHSVGPDVPWAGFYTIGEIGSVEEPNDRHLYTSVVLALS